MVHKVSHVSYCERRIGTYWVNLHQLPSEVIGLVVRKQAQLAAERHSMI